MNRHIVAAGLFMAGISLLGACASAPVGKRSRPLEAARSALREDRHREARDILIAARPMIKAPDARRERAILLGEAWLGLKDSAAAGESFYLASSMPGEASRDQRFRVADGLARAERGRGRDVAAKRHLENALRQAVRDKDRDRVRMELAEIHLARNERSAARALLAAVEGKDARHAKLWNRAKETVVERRKPVTTSTSRGVVRSIGKPKINDRSQWGAIAIKRGRDVRRLGAPRRITVHHGGEAAAPPTSIGGAVRRMRSYQNGHLGRNWADIGYHYVIDGSGRIWQGRDIRYQGAHAGSPTANIANIGVCLMGNFESRTPSAAQKKGLETILVYLMARYRIEANRIDGHNVVKKKFVGQGTSCPGRRLESYLSTLKRSFGRARPHVHSTVSEAESGPRGGE